MTIYYGSAADHTIYPRLIDLLVNQQDTSLLTMITEIIGDHGKQLDNESR